LNFHFVDRVLELNKGKSIVIQKDLSATEQYLTDHFPKFPTMPGVLILEAAVQAASWLLREGNNFETLHYSVRKISNVKFGQFVRPGDVLEIKVDLTKEEEGLFYFKAKASLDGASALRVQFSLKPQPIKGDTSSSDYLDNHVRKHLKQYYSEISKYKLEA